MMTYRVYTDENYLFLEARESTDIYSDFKKDVRIEKCNKNRNVYKFYNLSRFKDHNFGIEIEKLFKKDDSPYTVLEFETFFKAQTGGGGGSSAGAVAGDASASNQLSGNASLTSIDTKTTSLAKEAKQDAQIIATNSLNRAVGSGLGFDAIDKVTRTITATDSPELLKLDNLLLEKKKDAVVTTNILKNKNTGTLVIEERSKLLDTGVETIKYFNVGSTTPITIIDSEYNTALEYQIQNTEILGYDSTTLLPYTRVTSFLYNVLNGSNISIGTTIKNSQGVNIPITNNFVLGFPDNGSKSVLDNILLELKDDINSTETVWYDKVTPTLFYVRRSSTNQDTGIVTVSFYNIDGTVATPTILNLVQVVSGTDYEFNTIQRKAIVSGIGYSVNDSIQELQIINMTLGTLVNTLWVNKTTDSIIVTPVFANLIIDDSYANNTNQALQITEAQLTNTTLGQKTDSPATTDVGTFSLISLFKRGLTNWTTFLGKFKSVAPINTDSGLITRNIPSGVQDVSKDDVTKEVVEGTANGLPYTRVTTKWYNSVTKQLVSAIVEWFDRDGNDVGLLPDWKPNNESLLATKDKQNEQSFLLGEINDKLDTSTIPFNVNVVNQISNSTGGALETTQLLNATTLTALNNKFPTLTNAASPSSVSLSVTLANDDAQIGKDSTGISQLNIGTGIRGWLSGIYKRLTDIDTKTPSIGQGLITTSSPVVLPISQITTLTPQTNALTDAQLRVNPIVVTGTFFQTVQPVSIASIPLATGSATAVLQTTQQTSLGNIDNKLTGVSTSALQTTGNTALTQIQTNTTGANLYLSNIDTKIGSIDFKTPSLGQALPTASVPVVLPLAQITTLTPPSNTGYALDISVNSLLKPSSTLSTVTTLGTITNALPTGSNTIGNTNQTQATSGFSKITDGVNNAVVTTALPATATSGLVVRQAPDAAGNTQIIGATPLTAPNVKITNQSGSATVSITGANISANTVDSALIVGLSPNSNKTGSEQGLGLPIGIVGSVVGGAVTTSAPIYVNGNFQQLSLNTAGGLRVENNTTQINSQPIAIQNGILNNATQRVVLANRTETIISNIGTLSDIPLTAGQRIKLLNHTNNTAVLFYLQIHNKATPLATGDIPQGIMRVPANSTINEGAGFFGESGTLYGANTRIGYSSTFGTYTATASTNKSINIITVA